MLTQFRVHELKELLKSLNCSTRGRKQELYVRSANLLEHGSPKIYKRIKEIHEKYLFMGRRSYIRSPIKGANFPTGNHSPLPPPPSFINYPNVVFKPHPFYEKIDTIVRPTSLGVSGWKWPSLFSVPVVEVVLLWHLLFLDP